MDLGKVEKRGFSLKELAMQVPLSVPFLRKEIKRGYLKSRKFGDRVVVMAEDWNDYLNHRDGDSSRGSNGKETEN